MTSAGDLLPIAVAAVSRGAHLVQTRLPEQLIAKGDRDYVSNVDLEIERDLRAFLVDATPEIGFLGEEEGMVRAGQRHWALDPIDGTVNFANALPLCAVSLALIEDDQPILGVVQLPFLERTYTATQGQGALEGGRRLAVAAPARLRDAIVSIGDYAVGPGAEAKNADRLAITHALAGEVLRVRMLGSAVTVLLMLAHLLSRGRRDKTFGGAVIRDLRRIAVMLIAGAVTYAITELTEQPRIWSLTITVLIGGIAFVVQFLVEVEGRLQQVQRDGGRLHQAVRQEVSKLGKASELYGLIEASALPQRTITELIEQAARIDRQATNRPSSM